MITFASVAQGKSTWKHCFSLDIEFPKGWDVPSFYLGDVILNMQGPAHSKCLLLEWMKNLGDYLCNFFFPALELSLYFPKVSVLPVMETVRIKTGQQNNIERL